MSVPNRLPASNFESQPHCPLLRSVPRHYIYVSIDDRLFFSGTMANFTMVPGLAFSFTSRSIPYTAVDSILNTGPKRASVKPHISGRFLVKFPTVIGWRIGIAESYLLKQYFESLDRASTFVNCGLNSMPTDRHPCHSTCKGNCDS